MALKDKPELEGVMLADGLDHAFMGLWNPMWGDREIDNGVDEPVGVATYDIQKIIEGYVKDGMTTDEAYEYFYYNVEGAYVGDNTPIFIDTSLS
jgi:hypothetical protein